MWNDDIEAAYQEQLEQDKAAIDQAEYEYYGSMFEKEQQEKENNASADK
jgi:hypothetical protein